MDDVKVLKFQEVVDVYAWLLAKARWEASKYRAHILDIDGHATPYGDIPKEPGWVGTYLLTAGALHRALGTLGESAPSCQAEHALDRIIDMREKEQTVEGFAAAFLTAQAIARETRGRQPTPGGSDG